VCRKIIAAGKEEGRGGVEEEETRCSGEKHNESLMLVFCVGYIFKHSRENL